MPKDDTIQLATELVCRDFELAKTGDVLSEDELFQLLADHIDDLIQHRMEWLLSLLYRMDVDEAKVQAALSPMALEAANIGLARLVLERQKQRVYTKRAHQSQDLGKEWEW